MDGCEDGILKTIVAVMVPDVYDSHFFFFISAGVGMKDEPAVGRNAPTHRDRF